MHVYVRIRPDWGFADVRRAALAFAREHLADFKVPQFLDVRTEPLPPAHPFWAHPGITVTPHIAAETRPATAARVVAENLRRAMDGRPLLYQVDRSRGY